VLLTIQFLLFDTVLGKWFTSLQRIVMPSCSWSSSLGGH